MLLCAAQGSFLCKGIEEDVSAAVVIFHFGFQPGGQLHPVALVGRRFLKAIDPALEAGRQRAPLHRAHQVSAAVVHDVARQHLYLQGSLLAIRRAHHRQHPLQRTEHHQHRRAGREQHQHNPAAPDLPFAASGASSSIPRQKMRFPGDCCGSIHPWYSGRKRVVVPKKEAAARQAGRFISHREAPGFATVNPSILPFPLNTV